MWSGAEQTGDVSSSFEKKQIKYECEQNFIDSIF